MSARKRQPTPPTVKCGECGRACGMVSGEVVYPHRPDLAAKQYWRCSCGAYVGCHDGTIQPLGVPASKATHAARIRAHAAFDPLWLRKMQRDGVSKKDARGAAYKWLAGELGIEAAACHIGMMDAPTALRVVALCLPYSNPKEPRHDPR